MTACFIILGPALCLVAVLAVGYGIDHYLTNRGAK